MHQYLGATGQIMPQDFFKMHFMATWSEPQTKSYFIFNHHFKGFPDSSVGKESDCNAGDPNLIPGLGRSAGKGIGSPLQSSYASLLAQLVKNSGDLGLIPGLGRSPGEGKGYAL